MAVMDEAAAATRGRWKPYPKYRDSGLDWLCEVPAHWGESRLAHLGQIVGGMTPATGEPEYWDGEIPWVTPKDMKRPLIDSAEDTISERAVAEIGLAVIEPPAVLIVVRGMILAHSLPVAVTALPVTVNQDMKALRLRPGVDPQFIRYLLGGLASAVVNLLVEESSHGTKVLRLDRWRRFALFIPPIDEQRAIVAFLDRETARMDALIAKKQRIVALLSEKRIALIASSVTRGLSLTSRVYSGVPWLGDLPRHWSVVPLKHVVRQLVGGGTPDTSRDENWAYDGAGVPWVAIADMTRSSTIIETDRQVSEQGVKERRLRVLPAGTLLYSMYASVGRVAVLGVPAATNQAILGVLLDEGRITTGFLFRWLEYMERHVAHLSGSNTQENLSEARVRRLPVFLPPIPEQRRIVEFLGDETARIDATLAKVRNHVALLREYRSALISAAVTGKIDVRDEVAA